MKRVAYRVNHHGSIWLVWPETKAAKLHLETVTDSEAQWYAGALVVEHRYIAALIDALARDGFRIRVNKSEYLAPVEAE
jgi:hypothetical protein